LAVSLVLSGLTLWVASALRLPDNAASFFGSAAAAAVTAVVPAVVGSEVFQKRRGTKTLIADAAKGQIVRPIGLVVVTIGGILLLFDTLAGWLEGVIVASMASTDEQAAEGLLYVSAIVVPALLICAFFIVERGAHFIESRQWRWSAVAVGGWVVARALIVLVLYPALFASAIPGVLGVAAVVLLLAWPATRLARRNHGAFVASHLFRRLPTVDQLAAINLLQEGNGRSALPATEA